MLRETVSIEYRGERLTGIHDRANRNEMCIVMLSAGLQNRCGARRFYWRVANSLREIFGVLRVDLSGAGDSTSEASSYHFDLHEPNEVSHVIEYTKHTLGYKRIILLGLCAGARAALKTASLREDIEGVVALNSPMLTGGLQMPVSPLEPENRIGNVRSKNNVITLLKFFYSVRFLQLQWWRNRLRPGRSVVRDASKYAKSIIHVLSGQHKKPELNSFVESVQALITNQRKILFVYGELDHRPLSEFREQFPELNTSGSFQSYHLIERGDHVFSSLSAQEKVIDMTRIWLLRVSEGKKLELDIAV